MNLEDKYDFIHPNALNHAAIMREFRSILRSDYPGLWRKVYPRAYADAGGYCSPREAAAHLAEPLLLADMTPDNPHFPDVHKAMIAVAANMIEHRIPTWFVKRDLLQALALTDFKDEIPWRDIPLPHDAGLFIMPQRALYTPDGVEVGWIAYGRVREGVYLSPNRRQTSITVGSDFFLAATAAPTKDDSAWYHYAVGRETGPFRLVDLPIVEESPERIGALPLFPGDKEFTRRLMTLVWHILLFMEAQPEEISSSMVISRVKAKPGREAREFWSPSIIGWRYQAKRAEQGGGTHASPRGHWRRGHFTRQAHGPGRTLRKTLWIEPTWIGGVE